MPVRVPHVIDEEFDDPSLTTWFEGDHGDTTFTFRPNNSRREAITVEYNQSAEVFLEQTPIQALHWTHSLDEAPYVVAQIPYGNGYVTFLGDPELFDNYSIKGNDNGFFLLMLLSVKPESEVHYLLKDGEDPGLVDTLWREVPTTLVMFGLALLAWLFYAAARLGPVRNDIVPGRTNLMSHLRARGHFWRRRKNLIPLTAPVQKAAQRELKRQRPNLVKNNTDEFPPQLITIAASELSCTEQQLSKALQSSTLSVRDLPIAGQILQRILHQPLSNSSNIKRSRP